MRILWISMCAPYSGVPHAGGQTLEYYLRNFAKQADHEITLIAKLRPGEEEHLEAIGDGVRLIPIRNRTGAGRLWDLAVSAHRKLNPFSPYGNTLLQSVYNAITRQLKKLKNAGYVPDAVVLEWGQMVLFVDKVKAIFPDAKIVASEHDVMFLGLQRMAQKAGGIKKYYAAMQYRNILRRELKALGLCDLIVAHNGKDKLLLLDHGVPPKKLHTIAPYYHKIELTRDPNRRDILFFGDMRRPENYLSAIWFIENVMPLLKDRDVRFVVLGGSPDEKLKRYSADNVIITGFVEDIVPYFSSCCCMVAPLLLGAGIKVKLLEAMYAGLPILTNDVGIEGIPAEDGKDYLHCESAPEYARQITSLLDAEVDAAALSRNAKHCIEKAFNLEKSLGDYMDRIATL